MSSVSRIDAAVERVGSLELQYVKEVLDGSFRTSAGQHMTRRLEEAFAQAVGSRFAIALVNGTATLHTILAAAGIGPGDEVVVPPLTMASTALGVIHAGATPVFADVAPQTWTLDADAVRAALTERTRAIMPVALFGAAPEMDSLMDVAREHDLFVLEDTAQCFLGRYGDRTIGTIGNAGSFSLQSSKHLTSGEGGLIVTDDEELADAVRRFSGLGYAALGATKGKITRETIQDPEYVRHVSVGFNYRLPELCAAVALAQTERIEELVAVRVRAAERLAEAAAGAEWLRPQTVLPGSRHAYWSWAVALDHPSVTWHEFRDAFAAEGGDGIYAAWRLNHQEPAFAGLAPEGGCPVAESLQPRLLAFKTNYWTTERLDQQAEALARTIQRFE